MTLEDCRYLVVTIGSEEILSLLDPAVPEVQIREIVDELKKKTGLELYQIHYLLKACLVGKPN